MATLTREKRTRAQEIDWRRLADWARRYGVHGVLILLVIAASLLSPAFATPTNLFNVLRQAAPLGIVAVGQTFALLIAGLDLSVGSILSLSTVLVGNLLGFNDAMILPMFFLCLGFGALVGLANGILITRVKIPPIVCGLGMQILILGVGLLYTKGVPQNTLTDNFRILGLGHVGLVPIPVIVWFAVTVIGLLILNFTNFGRYVYAIGGNPGAARLSGVNVKRVTTLVYMLSGITAAIAGYVLVARLGVGNNYAGQSYALDSIAAVAVGGTNLFGGRGGLGTTVSGVLVLSVIYNLLLLLGISYYWQEVIKGAIIIGAVALYATRR